jgi:pilus assembly protein CpaF
VARLSDGTRKIIQISEIVGMEGDVITMQDIYLFEREGIGEAEKVLGNFRATGIRPRCSDRLKAYGIDLSSMLFGERNGSGATPPRPRW